MTRLELLDMDPPTARYTCRCGQAVYLGPEVFREKGQQMLEATTKDIVSIVTDDGNDIVVCSGRLWRIYREIGSVVLDCCEDEKDKDKAAAIAEQVSRIAKACIRSKEIK